MQASSTPDGNVWLIAGEPGPLARASALIEAHRAARPVRVLEFDSGSPPGGWWRGQLEGVRAVVLVVDPGAAISAVVAGTHLLDGERSVPVGVLPDEPAAIRAVTAVQLRAVQHLGVGPVVLLGSREERAGDLTALLETELARARGLPVRRLTAERLSRSELLSALATGPGLGIYVGQGHALGWGGYGGIQAWQLDDAAAHPVGGILSLTCHAASRAGAVRSFSEEVVARGLAGVALGAAGLTTHLSNVTLAKAIAERLGLGAGTLADALPTGIPELEGYRIAGDPLAPFIGARGSRRSVSRVFAPAQGDPLPPVDWSSAE